MQLTPELMEKEFPSFRIKRVSVVEGKSLGKYKIQQRKFNQTKRQRRNRTIDVGRFSKKKAQQKPLDPFSWQKREVDSQVDENENEEENYLDKVFIKLEEKKGKGNNGVHAKNVFKNYKTIPIQKLQPKKLYKKAPINGKKAWSWGNQKETYDVFDIKESCPLSYLDENGFFKTFYDAYMNHGDVKITPDDIWLTILLYLSRYIYKNSEQLRDAFVNHKEKQDIIVISKNDDEKTCWKEFLEKVIIKIKKKTVKGVTQKLECDFSTTNEFAKFMSTAAIMNAYRNYFNYILMAGMCGIANIHMGGTQKDWQRLEEKLMDIRQFDVNGLLKRYVDRLLPVLSQFTQTYKGNVNLQFWNNIYHERKDPYMWEYLPIPYINGWLLRFFTLKEEYFPEDPTEESIKMQEIDVPVRYINFAKGYDKQLFIVGGCKGVSVEKQKIYRPHFSYAVVQKKKRED